MTRHLINIGVFLKMLTHGLFCVPRWQDMNFMPMNFWYWGYGPFRILQIHPSRTEAKRELELSLCLTTFCLGNNCCTCLTQPGWLNFKLSGITCLAGKMSSLKTFISGSIGWVRSIYIYVHIYIHMGVSKNNGTPKSSTLIGFSIINHPFWGFSPYFLETPIYIYILYI